VTSEVIAMSARKFRHPRHGHLGFLPRQRTRHAKQEIRCYPKDDPKKAPHLTAFIAYKAGMTHVVREVEKPGSKLNKKEVVDAVTILETPPMVVVGIAGYVRTPHGIKCLHTIWAQHLSDEFRRGFYKNWFRSKRKNFSNHLKNFAANAERRGQQIAEIKQYCDIIRVIAHTQPKTIKATGGRKKAQVLEVQVNGGATADKVDFALGLFEQQVKINTVFEQNEMIDTIAATKGHGFEGVTHRWGVTRLPRKTHKGLRKVACIGAWHPSRVSFTVPRAGQHGFHRRTIINRKIYKVGQSVKEDKFNARLEADLTDKEITPMGGFKRYGRVENDFLVVKGSVPGHIKRAITLRKSVHVQTNRVALEKINLKFIDTASKRGNGRFQTGEEKRKFMGPLKRDQKAK
jgi:large subunit ribosomal protein L3e